ncbi:hypothetical protein QQ045_005796 [Rhodiola kirilowii]
MVCESSDGYLSRCISLSAMQLYSPCNTNSPKRKSQAWSPEGSSNNGFDFEFMSRKIAGESSQDQEKGIMCFADDIFSNGQVMPLKPPPRLAAKCSAEGLPRCPSSSGGLKHTIQRMWTNDSDPFQKAAEKVRTRRSRSVSVKVHQWTINDLNASEDLSQYKYDDQNNQESDSSDPRMINRVAEPRGLVIARKLRPLSMDQGKESMKQSPMPLSLVNEKKHRVKSLLSRSVRIGKELGCRDGGDQRHMPSTGNATKNEWGEREIKTVVKKHRFRPKMMLCLGFQKEFICK